MLRGPRLFRGFPGPFAVLRRKSWHHHAITEPVPIDLGVAPRPRAPLFETKDTRKLRRRKKSAPRRGRLEFGSIKRSWEEPRLIGHDPMPQEPRPFGITHHAE